MPKITPFLWFTVPLDGPVSYYGSVFRDVRVVAQSPMTATLELEGQRFHLLHGGPHHAFNEAVSFFVDCEDQAEVDFYWERLTADGGSEGRCGWLEDKYGLSWQIVPGALGRHLSDPDRQRADRVMKAMLTMKKIDIAALDRAAEAD